MCPIFVSTAHVLISLKEYYSREPSALQTDASGTCETSYSVRSEQHSYAHSHAQHDACDVPGFYNVTRSRDFRNCTSRPLEAHAFLFGADRSDEQLARVSVHVQYSTPRRRLSIM